MNYLLYNNIRNIVKDDIKNIKSSFIGGAFSDILLKNDTKKFEEQVITLLTKMKDFREYDKLKVKLNEYKTLLEDLDTKLGEENIPNSGYLDIARQIQQLLDPLIDNTDPSKGRIISNLFKTSNNFTIFIDGYKDFLDKNTWNEDRIASDTDVNDIDSPDRFNIYIKTGDSIEKFNTKLKMLFAPILNDLNKPLEENIDENIQKVDELSTISKKFSLYISQKKKNIDDILKTEYKTTDIIFEDNTSDKIKSDEYLIDLQNIVNNSSLELGTIFNLENDINNIVQFMNIRDEMKSIEKIDIFDNVNLNDVLNIDNAVKLKGGDFESKYYTTKSSKKMLNLSKKLEKLFEILDTTLDDAKYLKQLQIRYNLYIAYLFIIIRNSASKLNPGDNVKIYEYLSKDKIDLYLDILNKINNGFTNIDPTKNGLKYLNEYHYLTINKLINLLEFLKRNFPSDKHLIRVLECIGNVNNDLILFNHFRLILIKFCESPEGNTYLNGKTITDL